MECAGTPCSGLTSVQKADATHAHTNVYISTKAYLDTFLVSWFWPILAPKTLSVCLESFAMVEN